LVEQAPGTEADSADLAAQGAHGEGAPARDGADGEGPATGSDTNGMPGAPDEPAAHEDEAESAQPPPVVH